MTKRFVFLSLLLSAAIASAADVRLRSAAVCGTSVIRVADVAEVFASDQRVAQALAEIPLCPAPASGQERVLSQEDIRQWLDLSGVERAAVTITGSESVTISAGDSTRTASAAKQPLVASGVRQAVFEVPSQPAIKQPAVRPTPVKAPPSDATKTPVSPPFVEKGVSLTVHARSSGIQITTSGKAIEAGSLGDSIAVELADTKQRVVARITAPQTVELTTGQSTNSAPSIASKP